MSTLSLTLPTHLDLAPPKPKPTPTPLWHPPPHLIAQYPTLRHLLSCTSIPHLRQIHAAAVTSGAVRDNFVSSRLLAFAALSPSPSLPYALLLFSSIPRPDPFSSNLLIRALSSSPQPLDALLFYSQLLSSSAAPRRPDPHTFPLLLKACSLAPSLPLGQTLHSQLIKLGIHSHVPVQNGLIQMYGACGLIDAARAVFVGMADFDDASHNVMIGALISCGCFDEARKLFDEMPEKNVVSWSVMVNAYVQSSRFKDGLELFREMLRGGVEPNESVYVNVLSACAHLGALEQGRWVESYLKKKKVRISVRVGTTLLDMYLKCGCVERACEVFDMMQSRNALAWSAMIAGLAVNGHGRDALRLFSKMEAAGMRPNEVTFIGVLNACSHCGMVDEGLVHFNSMTEVYGLKPNVQHYCCLVDLYGRAGMLDRAEKVLDEMPVRPNAAVWGALLNACRIHGNVNLGERVGKKLLELEPSNSGRYMLLSHIFAASGKWDDVAKLRRTMKAKGVVKTPGSSFIELKGTIHEFIAGDNLHPRKREIYEKLEEMRSELKKEGYTANTKEVMIDMDEEEKETALCHHSEKLAIAFGLIESEPATTIRITKNLRVCADCHSATKLISKIYDREIVVRDRSRFHHFREGTCSCGDFW